MNRKRAEMVANPPDSVALYAKVGSGSFSNALYNFELGGWSVSEHPGHMLCTTLLPKKFNESDVYSAISNLENIMISLFVNDHIPRRIAYFDHSHDIPEKTQLALMSILGQCGDPVGRDKDLTLRAFSQAGFIFTFKPNESVDAIAPFDSIKEWFELLKENGAVAASIGLIQESFAALNEFSMSHRYHDYLALAKAIILLISGLEGLFFNKSDDKADITFKFKLVGALFYERYATEDFMGRFGSDMHKLSFNGMKDLLGHLYDIRSMIAHGKAQSVLRGKELKKWKAVFELLHVGLIETSKRSIFLRHIVLALGLFYRHLFALLSCSKENLTKGAKIVNEIL
jgi:hypothetical protein